MRIQYVLRNSKLNLYGSMGVVRLAVVMAIAAMTGGCGSASGNARRALPPAPAAVMEEDATLITSSGNILGTLQLPAARFPVPVVLLIAGSGPTDRNGNSAALPGRNNSLKMLADGLAQRGVATLRYDKRGIGASRSAAKGEEELRFTHFVGDANDWVRKLRADPRFSTVTIAGHSEGSLIGMISARETAADGYVSIAGVGRKAPDVIAEQLSVQVSPAVLTQVRGIMERIEKGEKPDSVPAFLNALFRPSVQPYLTSWFAYDPAREIAKLSIPVLIIQGTTDLQVKVADANLLAAANPRAKLVIVDGMNHVLKSAKGTIAEQLPAYGDSTLAVVPIVIDEIASLVKSAPRPKDSAFGIDKLKHFLMAGFVESVAFAGLEGAGADRGVAIAGAGFTAAVFSVGREYHDRRTTGLFSFGDLVWDGLGAAAAMLVLTRVRR